MIKGRRAARDRQHRVDLGPAREHAARPPTAPARPRLLHLTKQLAVELGDRSASASTRSARGRSRPRWPSSCTAFAIRTDYYDTIPLGRYGSVEEMAQTPSASCAATMRASSTASSSRWTAASDAVGRRHSDAAPPRRRRPPGNDDRRRGRRRRCGVTVAVGRRLSRPPDADAAPAPDAQAEAEPTIAPEPPRVEMAGAQTLRRGLAVLRLLTRAGSRAGCAWARSAIASR